MTQPKSSCLIVGQKPDPHIDIVEEGLKDRGCSTFLLNRKRIDKGATLLIEDGTFQTVLREDDRYFHHNAVGTVWWRLKPTMPTEFGLPSSTDQSFAWSEWKAFLKALHALFSHARWLNPIPDHRNAGKKIVQLRKASHHNLPIPDTIITNAAEDAARLFTKHDRVVYKTLSSFVAPPYFMVFTNEISLDDLKEKSVEIGMAPGIFQEYLEKDHEKRVTIVGDSVFTVKIDSQKLDETKTDWRHNQYADLYEKSELPKDTKESLLDLHADLGLVYGAYDFVVKPNGEHVFLECNPGGQWLWLEEELGIDISKKIVNFLDAS